MISTKQGKERIKGGVGSSQVENVLFQVGGKTFHTSSLCRVSEGGMGNGHVTSGRKPPLPCPVRLLFPLTDCGCQCVQVSRLLGPD